MPNNVHTDPVNLRLSEVKIKYLGPKVREALEKGGIQTVADLAGSSVEDVESILESEVPPPTRTPEKIAGMIQEAQEIDGVRQESVAQAVPAAAESRATTVPEFTVFFNYGHIEDGSKRWRAIVHPHGDGNKPEPPKWFLNPIDEGYTVRFEYQPGEENQKPWRTVVYNGKSLEETDITGWTPDEWWPWISERALLTEEALKATVEGEKEYKQAQEALGQELDEERAQAQLELEQSLAEERKLAKGNLERELDEERAQAQLELKQMLAEEHKQAEENLERELDEERAQAQLELEQSLTEERKNAQEALEQAQLRLKQILAKERKQAEGLERELDEERAQAQLELERSLAEYRKQAQEGLEREFDEKRVQAQLKLEQSLAEERKQAQEDLEDITPYFQYLGNRVLTVMGPRTRKLYLFDHPGAVVAVDPRDRRAMAGVSILRQVNKQQNT